MTETLAGMALAVLDGVAILHEAGDLDAEHVVDAERSVHLAFERPTPYAGFVVDLSQARFLDSTGLGLLISIRMRCQESRAEAQPLPQSVLNSADRPEPFPLPRRTPLPAARDDRLERIAELTRRAVNAPQAFVILVDEGGQVVPGRAGVGDPDTPRAMPLSHSICQHVVRGAAPLVLSDTRSSDLLRGNLAVEDFAAYAGMPLTDHAGQVVGSLCVTDSEPREWTPAQLDTLAGLAEAASSELQLRTVVGKAAVAADRQRIAQQLNDIVRTLRATIFHRAQTRT